MVEILWETELNPDYNKDSILEFCKNICDACGVEKTQEFSLVFVDNARIAQINQAYRNKAEPTDVLSFAFEDHKDWPQDGPRILGEIFISTQGLASNAQYFKVNEEEELKRLIIHGILHLCGHDHQTNNEDEPMLKKQEEILDEFRVFSLKK